MANIKLKYTYETENGIYIGHLDDYPKHPTQGVDLKDLEDNLIDIYKLIQSGEIDACKHGVLEFAG